MTFQLLAQQVVGRGERLRGMQDRFAQPEPGASHDLVLLAVMVGGLLALAVMLNRIQRRRSEPNRPRPFRLFLRLLASARVPWCDRVRLCLMVRTLKIANPGSLLIASHRYDQAVDAYCQSEGLLGRRSAARPRLIALRKRLFPRVV